MLRVSRSLVFVAALGVVVWLAGSAAAPATVSSTNGWAQNGGGAARHASNPGEMILNRVDVSRIRLQPQVIDASGGWLERPIISDHTVFTIVHGAGTDQVAAWSEDGASLWTTNLPLPSDFVNNPAVADGVVVVSNADDNLYGLSETDGSVLWATFGSSGPDTQPVIANGVVYVAGGQLQAVDLHTGAVLWAGANIDTGQWSGPTVWDSEVFVYVHPSIAAYDTTDGHLLWTTSCAIAPATMHDESPMVLEGVVYEGAGCALNATTGAPVWTSPSGVGNGFSNTTDATGGRRIFTGYLYGTSKGNTARLEALNRTTGQAEWHHNFLSPNTNTPLGEGPIEANGVVYSTDLSQSTATTSVTIIRAYNTATGQQLWHSAPITALIQGVSIADGRIWAITGTNVRYWALP